MSHEYPPLPEPSDLHSNPATFFAAMTGGMFTADQMHSYAAPLMERIAELDGAVSENEALGQENKRLRADLKAMEGFADLWYFVSDEAPLEFEKIVSEYSPGRWMTEAHKLRAAKRGA